VSDATRLLDVLPLWGVFVATLLLVLAAVEAGYRAGRRRRARAGQENDAPVGAMVGAALGLLAFLLAFTFGLAAARFDTRRQIVVEEANAIGTTYLRAAMLSDAHRKPVRDLLREYVDVRLGAAGGGPLDEAVRRSTELQDSLWTHAVAAGQENPGSIVVGLFVQALNETIDVHGVRLATVRTRIPGAIWMALYAVALVALAAMGYQEGLARETRSVVVLAVAIAFSLVLWLIADLDRPQEGSLRVSQRPMIELRASMTEP
jgi:hypothetical protein